LSKRFADNVCRSHWAQHGAASLLVLMLAACGASTPRQAEVESSPVAAPEAQAPPARGRARAEERATAEQAEPPRERRGRRAPEPTPDATAAGEPVDEAAAAAHSRAVAALRAGNWLEAELELEQLTAEHPQYPGPHVNLALVYLNDGRRDVAQAALERALELDAGHAAANTQLGILLREQGKFDEAEAAYRRALATDPGHALAHYNLGVLLDVYLRRPAEALEHYEAYQSTLEAPNETVGRWIIDLRRRVGSGEAARVAEADAQ
jgi:Tfp pilus assembly protein PilF